MVVLENFFVFVYLAFATSAVSITFTKAGITASLRGWLRARSEVSGALFHCPYCFSHWVASMLVAYYRPELLGENPFVEFFVSLFAVIGLAAIISGIIVSTIPSMSKPKKEKEKNGE